MNVNDIVAIALLFVAITDSAMAQFVLPKTLVKNPGAKPEGIKMVIRLVHITSLLAFGAALFFYIVRPL